jgi:CheY-like chemotaxis protein
MTPDAPQYLQPFVPDTIAVEAELVSPYALVVDDNHDLVEVMTTLLERKGYRCRGVANGLQALEVTAISKPSLVLLDVEMPVMGGWECARWLRSRHGRALPIVLLATAPHRLPKLEQVAIDGVLVKPFAADELLRVVGEHLPARS